MRGSANQYDLLNQCSIKYRTMITLMKLIFTDSYFISIGI